MTDEREAKIRRLFPLVRSIARRIARIVPGSDLDDLIGDGSVGLIRAVDRYDPTRGVTLETYARRLITGAILNGLRRLDPVSERIRRMLRKADARRFEIAQQCGSFPRLSEIERNDAQIEKARATAYRLTPLSLDAPFIERTTVLADESADPARRYDSVVARRDLAHAIDALPERQRRVLAMHYYGEIPLRHVSRTLKISPQRTSQLHITALSQLRGSLGSGFVIDTER